MVAGQVRLITGHGTTPAVQPGLALDLRGGDAWEWEKRFGGTCSYVPADSPIQLLVNGEPSPTERDGDSFSTTARLAPGANEVIAQVRMPDGTTLTSEPVIHTVRLTPRPTARIRARLDGDVVTFDGGASEVSEYDALPIQAWSWTERPDNPEPFPDEPRATQTGGAADSALLRVQVPSADGEYYMSLEVTDQAGRNDNCSACLVVEGGTARVMDPVVEEAAWIERAVVYGMVVRNFTNAGFRGVTDRLHELEALGITAIWFAPITRTLPGNFGYNVTDCFNLRDEYGTLDDFRALVEAAHACGIRVLMDFVPNHTSERHPYFVDASEYGETSPYYDWYARDDGGKPTHYFHWSHLPNLNFDNPEVRRFVTEAFSFWMREYDVDGFRVDVAWGIKQRRPGFWLECSAELNRIKPDCLLIAEASARDPYYVQNGFDAAYDWTDELGVWAWGASFASGLPMGTAMRDALTDGGKGYDPDSLVFRFLNNNDTGERFMTVHGLDYYRTALAMLMTLHGIPCVYTGDEVGAQFLPYKTRVEIDWSDPNDLRDFVQRLIALRSEHPALHSRSWGPVEIEPAGLFGYLREGADGKDRIVVVVNFSANDVEAVILLPQGAAGPGRLVDLWTDEALPDVDGDLLPVTVAGWGFRMIKAA